MITDYAARNILVCLRYGIGDVVMETPVLRALRRALPASRITLLGAPPAIELLEGDTVADEVVSLARWGIRHRWHRGDPDARARLDGWLEEQAFDLFLDVHHVAPVVREAVWGRGVRSLEADERVESTVVANGGDGVSAIRRAASAGWGLEVPPDAPSLHVPGAAHRQAEEFLRSRGLQGQAPIALSPVASSELKRWPSDRFALVADELLRETGRPLLLFCGPQAEAREVAAQVRRSERVVTVGAMHLQLVAALLSRCRLLLCNDTGLMHMAAAVGVATVGIFGPTNPGIYRPPFRDARSAHDRSRACSLREVASMHPPRCISSGHCRVGVESCIRDVAVDPVLRAARSLLDPAEPPRGELEPLAESS